MKKLFLWLNSIFLVIAAGGIYYILLNINPTDAPIWVIWLLIACVVVIAWSIFTYLGYSVRLFLYNTFLKNRNSSYIFIRSERQGLLLGLLLGLQIALQGFLLFNVLSATILTIAILLLEFFFIAQETKQ